jgi:hypothetical protein
VTILGLTVLAALVLFITIGLFTRTWNVTALEKYFGGRLRGDTLTFPRQGRTIQVAGFLSASGDTGPAYLLRCDINIPYHFRIETTRSSRWNPILFGFLRNRQRIGNIDYFVKTDSQSAFELLAQQPALGEWLAKWLDRPGCWIGIEKSGHKNTFCYGYLPNDLIDRYLAFNGDTRAQKPPEELQNYVEAFDHLASEIEKCIS